jgi:Ca-activated chloride channel family protein
VLDGARPGDEFAVVEFKERADLVEEFTSNPSDVRAAMDGFVAFGQTAVLDAVYVSAEYAQRESRNRLRAVVLVTDGLDKNSYYSFDRLVGRLRKLDVRLYIVGLTLDLDRGGGIFRASDKEKADDLLLELARDTGGRAFFPKQLEELGSVNAAIAADLRSVYSIGYYPKNQKKDGAYRAVAVKVLGEDRKEDGRLVVRTRSGYVADKS